MKKLRISRTFSYLALIAATVGIFFLLILCVGSDVGKALTGFWKGAFGST